MNSRSLFPFLAVLFLGSLSVQQNTTDYTKKKKFNSLEERSKVKYRLVPIPS